MLHLKTADTYCQSLRAAMEKLEAVEDENCRLWLIESELSGDPHRDDAVLQSAAEAMHRAQRELFSALATLRNLAAFKALAAR